VANILGRSVLIVDDNQAVRRVLRQFFETLANWKIAGEAADGFEAIEKSKEVKPDLILMDVRMPNFGGIEAASILKKLIPDSHIIVFTLFDDALVSRLSAAAGVDLVVPKTEGLTGLVNSIQRLIGAALMLKRRASAD
jgi:DNA-binding NarL/FixJ family response regulator